jgi:hypothetical protein
MVLLELQILAVEAVQQLEIAAVEVVLVDQAVQVS